jgi:hypothetical protein
MPAKGDGLWVLCAVARKGSCSKSGTASCAVEVVTPGKWQHTHVCSGCAKALGLKRSSLIPDTDAVEQRANQTHGEALKSLQGGSHKVLYTKGGSVKGSHPLTAAEVAAARGVKVAAKAATKVPATKVPAKATPKATPKRKRPAAKVA